MESISPQASQQHGLDELWAQLSRTWHGALVNPARIPTTDYSTQSFQLSQSPGQKKKKKKKNAVSRCQEELQVRPTIAGTSIVRPLPHQKVL
jgi:hypothetical protein